MNFFKRLFGKKKKEQTVSFTLDLFGKEHTLTMDMSEEAIKKRAEKYVELEQTAWQGKNQISSVRDDGVIVYKSNRVTSVEKEQVGFYGLKWFSENNKYCVVYLSQFKDEAFNLGLIDVSQKKVLFKKKLQRPHRCRVTDKGIIICEDWKGYEDSSCYIYVISPTGKILKKASHKLGIGDVFELIEDDSIFRYNINSTGKIHLINLKELR